MRTGQMLFTLPLMLAALGAQVALPADLSPATATSGYVQPNIAHASYGNVKVVVPLTSNDKRLQTMKLRNIANALKAAQKWHGTFDVTVVLYGSGLSLLENPDETTRKQLDLLKSQGVRIEVCNNSLIEQNLNYHTLYRVTDRDVVPSGFAEVAYLQWTRHYAVDPVN